MMILLRMEYNLTYIWGFMWVSWLEWHYCEFGVIYHCLFWESGTNEIVWQVCPFMVCSIILVCIVLYISACLPFLDATFSKGTVTSKLCPIPFGFLNGLQVLNFPNGVPPPSVYLLLVFAQHLTISLCYLLHFVEQGWHIVSYNLDHFSVKD